MVHTGYIDTCMFIFIHVPVSLVKIFTINKNVGKEGVGKLPDLYMS